MPDRSAPPKPPAPPVMKVTRYDRVSSFLMALIIGLVLGVVALVGVWYTNRLETPDEAIPLELLELPGGVEEGSPEETLKVDSPDPETPDPSLAELPAEESQIEQNLESVIELAEQAAQQVQEQYETDPQNVGKPGSASGTGKRPLGSGPGDNGFPREQRWYLHFSERSTPEQYAEQLDQFGIELGLLQGNRLTILTDLSAAQPTKQVLASGTEKSAWLYFTWRGGDRKKADIAIFQKAGVPVTTGTIFHFYPKETENLLAKLEHEYANRPATQIRRTYFIVEPNPDGDGYTFVVTRQFFVN